MRIEEILEYKTIPLIRAELQTFFFQRTMHYSYRFFQNNLSGSITSKITAIATSFERLYKAWQQGLYPVLLSFFISSCLMTTVSGIFSAILFCWFLIMIATSFIFAQSCLEHSKDYAQAENNFAGRIVDVFQNAMTVLRFSNENYETQQLDIYKNASIEKQQLLSKHLFKIHFFQGIASTIMIGLMVLFLIRGLLNKVLTPGDFAYILSASFWLIRTTWWASHQVIVIFKEVGTIKKSMELLSQPYDLCEDSSVSPLIVSKGEIRFNEVTFSYPDNDISFYFPKVRILPKEKIGLVGKTGSGKTTFINLLMRHFEINSGQIFIDDQNIKFATLSSLHKNISIVSQDTCLFHRTLLENIKYAKPEASRDEVIAACKAACCHDFIERLPDGYDTLVGERGVKLSAGQRQQISIARVFLKDTPILIIDEATSSLDALTEKSLQVALERLMDDRTTLIIAHRLNTILNTNRLLVFKDHQIIEEGIHGELIYKNSYYKLLWETQKNDFFIPSAIAL